MKRRFLLIVLALLLVFGLSSCDLWYAIFGDPIVGTWALTAGSDANGAWSIGTGPNQYSVTMTIAQANHAITGSATVYGYSQTATGTWSKSGSIYTLSVTYVTSGAGSGSATMVGTLSSDNKTLSLTVTPSTGGGTQSQTYTRQ